MTRTPASLAAAVLAQTTPDAGGFLYDLAERTGPIGIAALFGLLWLVAAIRFVVRPLADEAERIERVRIEHTVKDIERVTAAKAQTDTLERIAIIHERTTARLTSKPSTQEAA